MKQRDCTEELFKMIRENPDLPIVCWVDSDIVADNDIGRWQGSFGRCHIIEYINVEMYNDYIEMVYKDDTEDYEEFLRDTSEMTDEEIEKYINSIQWIKAIAVNIDLPD